MNVVVAAERPTPILWCRASGLESPTEVPASTLPALRMAPVRANMASRSVVLPLWKGPTSAMHRGPRGLLTSCPIAASSVGARPMIGSANRMLRPRARFGKRENVAAVRRNGLSGVIRLQTRFHVLTAYRLKMATAIEIRAFATADAAHVRDLFIRVNRLLAPPDMKAAFEAYIVTSLREEIDRIEDYYGDRDGGFWVALDGGKLVGMFGLEPSSDVAMELRRMYVAPDARRRGIARKMLA